MRRPLPDVEVVDRETAGHDGEEDGEDAFDDPLAEILKLQDGLA